MTRAPLILALSIAFPSCASALALTASQTQLLRHLEQEAAKDPAVAPGAEAARESAGRSFEGGGLRVQTLAPESFRDAPAERKAQPNLAQPPAPKAQEAPSYHFVPRQTAVPNLTIYRPERDQAGQANSTRPPSHVGTWIANGAAVAGAGALIAGLVLSNPVMAAAGGAVLVLGLLFRLLRR